MNVLGAALTSFFSGLKDGLNFRRVFRVFRHSEVIRQKALLCAVLNGGVFLGSMLLVNYVVQPFVHFVLTSLGASTSGFDVVFNLVYYLLWLWPVYVLSFFLSGFWFGDIAAAAFKLLHGKPPPVDLKKLPRVLADEARRSLLFGVFLAHGAAAAYLPYAGTLGVFAFGAWFNAFYAVDYTWSSLGERLDQRVERFHTLWLYFLGFGAPVTILTMLFPFLASAGILSLTFPLMIVCACAARPVQDPQVPPLPVFSTSMGIARMVEKLVMKWYMGRRGAAKKSVMR